MTFSKRGRYERLDAVVPIEVLSPGSMTGTHTVMCNNIGGKGFRFTIEQKLAIDTPLELTIHLPDDQVPLHAKGRVSWVRKTKQLVESPKILFDIGVEFLGLSFQERDRIHQYIYRQTRYKRTQGNP